MIAGSAIQQKRMHHTIETLLMLTTASSFFIKLRIKQNLSPLGFLDNRYAQFLRFFEF